MTTAVEAVGLGKRFSKRWALHDCHLTLPEGRVVGVVGANGAGKSTLLHLCVGLLTPTIGSIRTLGKVPGRAPQILGRVGYVAQDAPLYSTMSVRDHLRLARHCNKRFDDDFAAARIADLDIDPSQRAGSLSGGQRAQVALTLAVAKRPDLLVLDEPVAGLDPLARREFLQLLMTTVADDAPTVLLSSHVIADIERVCNHVVILADGQLQVADDVDHLLDTHRRLVGPRRDVATLPSSIAVIDASDTERQSTFLVRTAGPFSDADIDVRDVGLEEIVLAYLGHRGQTGGAPMRLHAVGSAR